MTRPRLLDLFCGAGGAGVGYHRAGFDVVGIDIIPQPNYPFRFVQADAMTYPLDGFDAIHASPPCQDHSSLGSFHAAHGTGWMLAATIDRLKESGLPWVVENVEGRTVTMEGWWFTLCGSAFGLGVRRHRRFGSDLLMLAPGCQHNSQPPRYSVYDHGKWYLSRTAPVYGNGGGKAKAQWSEAMGINWMDKNELAQAIPPAYTEWIGARLLEAMEVAA